MRSRRAVAVLVLPLAAAALALAACRTSTDAKTVLAADTTISADVARSAGDAAATALSTMAGNETTSGLSGAVVGPAGPSLSVVPSLSSAPTETRTRTCYGANGAVVSNCTPVSSVRTIVTNVTITQSRSGTDSTRGGQTVTWSGALHRVANDSMTRIFNTATPAVETSRSHSALTVDHDTTTFNQGTTTRVYSEAAHDSVEALTFALPHASNPFPIAGRIMRLDSAHVVATKGSSTLTRDAVRLVVIVFPADAQGNVTIAITGAGARTCSYNLTTRQLSNCH